MTLWRWAALGAVVLLGGYALGYGPAAHALVFAGTVVVAAFGLKR